MFRGSGFSQRADKDNLLEPESSVGHAVAYLVEALRYNPEGREFDS
jgi:hypothetical protein